MKWVKRKYKLGPSFWDPDKLYLKVKLHLTNAKLDGFVRKVESIEIKGNFNAKILTLVVLQRKLFHF